MTREDLIDKLRWLAGEAQHDAERAHSLADKALLEHINDAEVTAVYLAIIRWYE